jgi:hypothetical protein
MERNRFQQRYAGEESSMVESGRAGRTRRSWERTKEREKGEVAF